MNTDAFASGALFARTAAGNAELSRPASSLSVPQRKLLLLIRQGSDYATLIDGVPPTDQDRRRRDLLRLIELQLVTEVDANGLPLPARAQAAPSDRADPLSRFGGSTLVMPPPASPNAGRPQSVPIATGESAEALQRIGDPPGRRGPTVAIVAIVGAAIVGGASWWLTHVGTNAPAAGSVAQSAPSPNHPVPPTDPTLAATAPAPALTASPQPSPVLLAVATSLPSPLAPVPVLERGLKLAPSAPNPAVAALAPVQTAAAKPQQVILPTVPPAEAKSAARQDETPATNAPSATTASAPAGVPRAVARPTSTPARTEAAASSAPTRTDPTAGSAPAVDVPRPAGPSGPSTAAAVAAAALHTGPASAAPTLASAAPTSSPAAAAPPPPSAPKILSRVNPDFPREAALAGVTTGTVKARIRVAADGSVAGVDIVQADPARVFDGAVARALSQWKFEPTGTARTVDHEVEFR